jgi:hypothetical protein
MEVSGHLHDPAALPPTGRAPVKASKAIPVTGRGGLKVCEISSIPHCLRNQLTDKGIVSLTHWQRSTPEKLFLLLALISFRV